MMDPRAITLGTDRWLTDSRVYRLVWLGRWIERARYVPRTLLWAAEHEATTELEEVLGMAADVRGVKVAADESALRSTAAPCSSSSTRAPGLRVSATLAGIVQERTDGVRRGAPA